SLLLGVLALSVVLFFISLSFARKVIRPIEELAERERAYARHIAHELKTPLAVAKSDIQLALAVKEGAEEHLKSAVSEIGMMRDTVDDLLLFSAS
ncbi:MAG: histidine kinase dimerization/phospho-acceptor domain-containing protein, partial [Patescibacteria group bacterium]